MPHYSLIQILAAVIVLTAAATDIRSRRIPNWLSICGVCAGLVANWAISGLPGIRTSLGGMILGFGSFFVLYCLRAMGAGDVKLMAAVGTIVGPGHCVAVFIASAMAGGVLAAVLMAWFVVAELVRVRVPLERRTDLDALHMPHGVTIAAGTIACLLLAII